MFKKKLFKRVIYKSCLEPSPESRVHGSPGNTGERWDKCFLTSSSSPLRSLKKMYLK